MKLENVILPGRDPKSRWDVDFAANAITSIRPSISSSSSSDPASLLLPPLCHPHIHLDKAYLLTCNTSHRPSQSQSEDSPPIHAAYSDLTPQTGSFSEALSLTSQAKRHYTPEDLYLRGSQLLGTSVAQGVTSCRAFVELDHVTGNSCLSTALALKDLFQAKLKLQICAFAQDPIFSTEHGEGNRHILTHALETCGADVEVLGTTPYVEKSPEASLRNIEWAIETALANDLHLDFHLDYSLDETRKPMVWDVLRLLKDLRWNERTKKGRTIVLGHCTRLTLCSDAEMARLAKEITDSELPVHFVGLPTSDLFMMGRPSHIGSSEEDKSAHRPRGTLQVLDMIKKFGLSTCLSVNNVGNAFTPWGMGDPLQLASLGVGIYQAGTDEDAKTLFECVSSRARKAIGLSPASAVNLESKTGDEDAGEGETDEPNLEVGRRGELLLVRNEEWVGCPGHLGIRIPARQRVGFRDLVWDPPDIRLRRILRCEHGHMRWDGVV
ncbi:uncharacterized protein Z518_07027 [Rhinocladiella mackenziei CBS 650.93]|uniref:Rhinocladiella mackenziei CBS 650.93 unplaced genomic scaffold supercont1.5, whole genome shotgun sequence n=1 Tax=Rhinocladiella mackenziei CBS 650.93 TaxID=1442369 RepID=A0A0D2ICD7_9EURO|nr:uncharacterized protein Z518_07027 [Rhinocladiella mackenziei CBS 650.93]KIX03474.1 hypothetical protein Z518_07027 [Rhinocladiella mackenziei CBS 650.93]